MRALALVVFMAVTTVATTVAAAQQSQGSPLPDIGSPADVVLSSDDAYRVGAMEVRALRNQKQILEDPESEEFIQSLGMKLASQAPSGDWHFHFFVVRDPAINAFAMPGGFVAVNYGTILASADESQLAGVMAHEIAHVTQRHVARSLEARGHQSITTMATILAAILIGAVGGGEAAEGGIAAAEGLAAQRQINFTRADEEEADRVGIGYLAHAGFDPYGLPQFFETLSRTTAGLEMSQIPPMLQDHPVTSDRIAEGRARAAQYGRPKHLPDPTEYELIRERLRVLMAPQDQDLAAYYAHRTRDREPPLAALYGQALAFTKDHHPAAAVRILTPLVQQHQSVILLQIALAQAQVAAGHTQQGLATFARADALFPRNVPVVVRYAQALMQAHRPKQAHAILLDLFNVVPPTPPQIRLTALAASAAGDTGDAYYYMSDYQIAGGNLPLAAQQLQLALAVPHLTRVQRKRFEARLQQIRDVLARYRRIKDGGNG